MADSISEPLPCDIEPTILVVSARSTLVQSIMCTSSLYGWEALDCADSLESAIPVVENYGGTRPLAVFIDDRLVEADPVTTRLLLAKMTTSSGLPPDVSSSRLIASRKYAILAARSDATLLHDFSFNGLVSPPFHRTQILSSVADICLKRRRPSVDLSSVMNISPPRAVAVGDPFPRGRLVSFVSLFPKMNWERKHS